MSISVGRGGGVGSITRLVVLGAIIGAVLYSVPAHPRDVAERPKYVMPRYRVDTAKSEVEIVVKVEPDVDVRAHIVAARE